MKYLLRNVSLLMLVMLYFAAPVVAQQGQPFQTQGGLKAHQHFTTTHNVPHMCGSSQVMDDLISQNPTYQNALQSYKRALPSLSAINSQNGSRTSPPVLTIPVVVHVIHNAGESIGTGQNLSIAQIQSQIDVLNERFRLLNSNFSSTPTQFQTAAADVEIEFCLANVGPGGTATNGITRTVMSASTITGIEDTIKPATNWDPALYLNIWSVPIPGTTTLGGILGYAYLPFAGFAGLDVKDGVVMDYRWFGTGNGVSGAGLTGVHEVGHYLGLEHTWGDNNTNGTPIGCSSDDGIADTPDQAAPTGSTFAGCPGSIPTSCGTPDMYVNYMDYVNDPSCQTMFTQDQTNVMRAVLNGTAGTLGYGDRSSLINNAATACSAPCSIVLTTGSTPSACVGNTGTATVSPSGGTPPYVINWGTNPVQTSGTITNLAPGDYNVTVTDVTNCVQTATVTVASASTLGGTVSATNETCVGNDGTATIVPSGGTPPYAAVWSTNPPQQSLTATGLTEGFYGVAVTDLAGCTYSDVVYVGDDCAVDCDTISNFDPNNFTATLYSNPFGAGFLSGTNSFGDLAKADYYDYQGPHSTITGAVLAFGVAVSSQTNTTLDVVVWDGTGGTPGAVLGVEQVSMASIMNDINNNEATVVQFATPVVINSSEFFVGFRIPQNGDIIGIATSEIGDVPVGLNRAWEQWSNGDWYAYDDSWGEDMVHAIGVELGTPPTAMFTPSTVTGCDSSMVAFTSTSLEADMHEWILPGGTPSTSNMENPTISYETPGVYDVTLVVHNGCLTDTMHIDSAITITSCMNSQCYAELTSTDVTCNGGSDGTAMATALDGSGTYTYSWSTTPVQTTASISNLMPGTYFVTVTDVVSGSVLVGDVTVGEPDAMMVTFMTQDETCINNDGEAIAMVVGGTAPYTYAWNTSMPTNSDTAQDLAAGTYIVTVTDANNCMVTETVTINDVCVGCNLTLVSSTVTPTCNDDSDGSIAITASLGTGGYDYYWSTGAPITDSMITGLSAGSYKVIVVDDVNCTDSLTIILTEPDALTVFETATPESCAGNDGIASVVVQGGTGTYSYVWNTVPPQTTNSIVGLSVGTYTVTVTDAANCDVIQSVTIGNNCPCGVTVGTTTTAETCIGNDGTASVTASGGTAPYTYLWDNGDTTMTVTGLAFGAYNVTVTDSTNCATITTLVVNDGCNCGMMLSGSATGESCDIGSDGTATVEVDGFGAPPYTFAWNTIPAQTTQTAFGLSQGNYTVTVTDATNCSQTLDVMVPGVVDVTISQSNASCNLNNGSLTAVATGGIEPYTYLWSVPGNTGETISGLGTGNYSVTVIDGNGCTATSTAVLVQNGDLVLNTIGIDNFCSVNGASAVAVAIAGGTAPFSYNWSNGDTTAQITSLVTGPYSVTVTDNNGCIANGSVNVTSIPSGPTLNFAQTNVSCAGGNDGAIDMTVTANSAVSIFWSNGVNAEDINGLGTGSYTVLVTDINGCVASSTVVITEPSPLVVNGTSTATVTNDGTASANVSGGTPPYTYAWNNGGSTQTISNLIPGSYTVTVTDDNGCTSMTMVDVEQFTGVLDLAELQTFELYPNPTRGQFTIDLSFVEQVDATVTIYSAVGQQVYNQNIVGTAMNLPINLSEVSNGIYFVMVTTEKGRAIKRVVLTK